MFAFFAAIFSHAPPETAVRATLADGQVVMGEVHTATLSLVGGVGTLEIPLADVGEVVPVEGTQIGDAGGNVDVWLRNGSELRGRWADPKLAMGIAVGGDEVPVDLPVDELVRFQLQGGESWPTGPVYRMRTAWGDDFLVDPTRTHLVVESKLGTFEPLLAECRSVAPVGRPDGDWRVELNTGTVLIGHLRDDVMTVALPMGPESVTVPLAQFVSLRAEDWGAPRPALAALPARTETGRRETEPPGEGTNEEQGVRDDARASAGLGAAEEPSVYADPAGAPASASPGWFDRSALRAQKAAPPTP